MFRSSCVWPLDVCVCVRAQQASCGTETERRQSQKRAINIQIDAKRRNGDEEVEGKRFELRKRNEKKQNETRRNETNRNMEISALHRLFAD